MKITLFNGTEWEALGVHGEPVYFQGVNRDSLRFLFDPERYTMEEIDRAFTAENCKSITLTGEDGEAFVHQGYLLRHSLEKGYDTNYGVSPGTERPPLRLAVRMARISYLEQRQEELTDAVDKLILSGLEG